VSRKKARKSSHLRHKAGTSNQRFFADELPESLNYQQRSDKAEYLVQLGVESKRDRRYQDAIKHYESAAKIAPWYHEIYKALGKLYYLTGERDRSIVNYLSAMHLVLGLGLARELSDDPSIAHLVALSLYPDGLLEHLRSIHPQAHLLLTDDISRHLGHTLIDLSLGADDPIELRENAIAYMESISGPYPAQLDIELEQDLYLPVGVVYLIEQIEWESVGKYRPERVRQLYSDPSDPTLPGITNEIELRSLLGILARVTGFSAPQTETPYSDLLGEMTTIWDSIDSETRVGLSSAATQAIQAAKLFVRQRSRAVVGGFSIHLLKQSSVYRPLMIRRWTDSTQLLQTPAIDFVFGLREQAEQSGIVTPVLQFVTRCLRRREVVDLRNGLVHSSYSWGDGSSDGALHILDRKTQAIVRTLDAEACHAYDGLLGTCALTLAQFSDRFDAKAKIRKHKQIAMSKQFAEQVTIDDSPLTGLFMGVCDHESFPDRAFCHITTLGSEITLWATGPYQKSLNGDKRVWRVTFSTQIKDGVQSNVTRQFVLRALNEDERVSPYDDMLAYFVGDELTIEGMLKARTTMDAPPRDVILQLPAQ